MLWNEERVVRVKWIITLVRESSERYGKEKQLYFKGEAVIFC